jgi:uncharacterized Tic20 family protein
MQRGSTDFHLHQEHTWALACHLAGMLANFIFPFGGLIATLLIWLLKAEAAPFVRYHAKEALNFQINVLVYALCAIGVGLVLFLLTIFNGFPSAVIILLFALGIFAFFVGLEIILPIIAGIKAYQGEYYRYPFTLAFLR